MKASSAIKYVSIVAVFSAMISCTKMNREETYSNQASSIQSYIDKQLAADSTRTVHYSGGVARLVIAEGDGDELNARGSATVYYVGYDFSKYTISNSYIFSTNDPDFRNSWNLTDDALFEPVTLAPSDETLIEGLRTGLVGVKPGQVCYIIFSGKYGFGASSHGTIPAEAPLAYYIRVEDVQN